MVSMQHLNNFVIKNSVSNHHVDSYLGYRKIQKFILQSSNISLCDFDVSQIVVLVGGGGMVEWGL